MWEKKTDENDLQSAKYDIQANKLKEEKTFNTNTHSRMCMMYEVFSTYIKTQTNSPKRNPPETYSIWNKQWLHTSRSKVLPLFSAIFFTSPLNFVLLYLTLLIHIIHLVNISLYPRYTINISNWNRSSFLTIHVSFFSVSSYRLFRFCLMDLHKNPTIVWYNSFKTNWKQSNKLCWKDDIQRMQTTNR